MDKWIIKKPKLDVESRDQHDTNYNNDPNFKRSEINEISSEVLLWKQRWITAVDKLPCTFIDAIRCCDELLFPKVYQYLKIGATLPITVASVERSFSTLKRLKSYLRNSTGENRLNGLDHLSIHREIPIQSSEVVDNFSEKNRKLMF
ncbi:HAT, C-terminal dimerisation domain [Cinara cedri]|uniref:HAT, C-terminal dimerisation domain n=1 Tax=Cinara cedri TaxID=506608 RepID=A0A5E4M7V2_9HEMI|nr:HAT, C-terminal dimerisation domain [Cinara cedri]